MVAWLFFGVSILLIFGLLAGGQCVSFAGIYEWTLWRLIIGDLQILYLSFCRNLSRTETESVRVLQFHLESVFSLLLLQF